MVSNVCLCMIMHPDVCACTMPTLNLLECTAIEVKQYTVQHSVYMYFIVQSPPTEASSNKFYILNGNIFLLQFKLLVNHTYNITFNSLTKVRLKYPLVLGTVLMSTTG
jgi:hypothetical protein